MSSATFLSSRDGAVLATIFDPESSLSNSARIITSTNSNDVSAQLQAAREKEEKIALLPLNCEDPAQSDVIATLNQLDRIIEASPSYASAWNNRAQARRMRIEMNQLDKHLHDLGIILADLSQAIKLATPTTSTAPLPAQDAKTLASAHTHRGYLLLCASRCGDNVRAVVSRLTGSNDLDQEQLEEMASHEFALGGRYGNETARQLAVRTNPYAKLCGSIVKEALQKEIEEHNNVSEKHIG